MFALLASVAGALLVSSAAADIPPYATPTYCTSTSSCWPTADKWQALNSSVGGRLSATKPFALPCYNSTTASTTACSSVQNGYLDGVSRAQYAGSMQSLNWEECNNQNCWLQSLSPSSSQTGAVCYQGRISPYSVAVTSPADIQAAISWAISNKVKFVIKNTGHSYLGRSSGPDTLQIWTRNLQSISVVDSYTPDGASAAGPAAVLGAGVIAKDVYAAVDKAGYSITLGAFSSVGVAGGFAMGGGHGPLGPKYGLAVDNVLQFRIVTADGTVRVANSAQNTDLFYALRGGGGGVFGVVYETTYAIHPTTPVQVASINVSPSLLGSVFSQDSLQGYLQTLTTYQTNWSNSGWAGYIFVYPSNISFNYLLPSGDAAAAQAQMAPWFNYLKNNGAYSISSQLQTNFTSVGKLITDYFDPSGQPNTPVGYGERLSGRLIPRSLFSNSTGQKALAKAIVQGTVINAPLLSVGSLVNLIKPVPLQIYSTGPANQPDNSKTGVNPAWRGSLWEVVFSSGWVQGFPQAFKTALANATSSASDPMRALTPGGGDYMNEADVLESDWQGAFFGSNYQTLLNIKQKYDPGNYFNVYKGVGWTGNSDPAYKCYANA